MSQASAQTPEKPPDRIGTNRRRLKLKIPFVAGSIRIGFWDRDDLAHELADTRQAVRLGEWALWDEDNPGELDRSSYVDGLDCVVAVGHRKADVDDAGPGERVAHPESAVADVRGRGSYHGPDSHWPSTMIGPLSPWGSVPVTVMYVPRGTELGPLIVV